MRASAEPRRARPETSGWNGGGEGARGHDRFGGRCRGDAGTAGARCGAGVGCRRSGAGPREAAGGGGGDGPVAAVACEAERAVEPVCERGRAGGGLQDRAHGGLRCARRGTARLRQASTVRRRRSRRHRGRCGRRQPPGRRAAWRRAVRAAGSAGPAGGWRRRRRRSARSRRSAGAAGDAGAPRRGRASSPAAGAVRRRALGLRPALALASPETAHAGGRRDPVAAVRRTGRLGRGGGVGCRHSKGSAPSPGRVAALTKARDG